MRIIKFLVVFLLILVGVGYGLYYFGTNFASEKIAEETVTEFKSTGQMETVKSYVENDPVLAGYMEEAKAADKDSLPFTTTGEATRVLIQKVGISELNDIKTKVETGTMAPQEVIQELETKLTEEELLALKVIAYNELYSEQ
ncbi:hypothetical protein [Planococcus shixiaomingii]|uniref:hypothetical protein n=1 Tax=Planococcus shixiaomingii TaxID=3058393 RepID=UPI00260F75BE|nr:hypothetical protein [Planococcus sp. N022]WKA53451.1 hypothetical protein QWY21_12350 [Planococcus sp. N022]